MLRLLTTAPHWGALCVPLFLLLGCNGPATHGSSADALAETLSLVNAEFSDIDLSRYVSLVASNGSVRKTVRCEESADSFGANVSSPTTTDGSVVRVDHLEQTWFISPGCYDQEKYGHFAGEFSMSVTLSEESGLAELSGWMETQSSAKCNFELLVTFDVDTGESMNIQGDLCGETVHGLSVPVFRD